MHWRRKWQPTPVFLPGESQGWGAQWVAVDGVTQRRTRLKRLSSSSSSSSRWGKSGSSDRFYFVGLQNYCGWYCSCEIKRCWLFGRKAMTNLDSILKSRDISLPTKVRLVKAMAFPVVMYGCAGQLDCEES